MQAPNTQVHSEAEGEQGLTSLSLLAVTMYSLLLLGR